jgi:photosystem II stability/assembly factor-like uncharacterized protein
MRHLSRFFSFAALGLSLVFVGAGCFIKLDGSGTASSVADGGLYRSADGGEKWVQKNSLLSTGEKKSLNNVSVASFAQDPQDADALYLGSAENGIFYSLDGGESWAQPIQIVRGRIASIAVHPKQKCVVYAAIENKLIKTTDCARSWNVAYLDPRTDKRVTSVVLENAHPEVVWIGTSAGDVIRSVDNGTSWRNVKNVGGSVAQLVVNSADNRKIFVATTKNGIFRTKDSGANWEDLTKKYSHLAGTKDFFTMAVTPAAPATLVFASRYGLLRSTDAGDSWSVVPLLTQPGTTVITSLVIDPRNSSVMLYATGGTYYLTRNGGDNWVPKSLPTTRAATLLMIDENDSSVVYMGTTKAK